MTILLDPAGTIRSASAALPRTLGHDPGLVTGTALTELVDEVDHDALHNALERAARQRDQRETDRSVAVEVGLIDRDGSTTPYQLTIVDLVDDPTVEGIIVSGQDITELHRTREELRRIAEHDTLTGLANRASLTDILARRLDHERRPASVAFIDIDRFKPVNDLYGHEAGDELLAAFAERLRHVTDPGDTVARLGGDEFVIVAELRSDLTRWAEQLDRALGVPYKLSFGSVQVFASVGAVAAHPGQRADTVVAEADATMYAVKHGRRGGLAFQHRPLSERRAIAEDLVAAFAEDQFAVHYQPMIDTASGYTVGYEALVRWYHPDKDVLVPAAFLDVVEDIGRDAELGARVLRAACRDLPALEATTPVDIEVSVNASAAQLNDPDFPGIVLDAILAAGIRPEQLILEVSERAILERPEHGPSTPVLTVLRTLSDLGVKIAVDDFGTGYSSLTHLVSFPVDIIKIDRSFVEGITQDPHRRSVVAALIGLARGMEIRVVAEGVETSAQAAALAQLGCTVEQGFLPGYPQSLAELGLARV